jgi:predicted nucleic acid-binding Zn ribbon protein
MAFKRCIVCGNPFDARRNAKTCSPAHSKQRVKSTPRDWKYDRTQQNKPRARTCVVCGKIFNTTTATKTCSPEHRLEHLSEVRRAAVRRYQKSAKAQETRRRYEQTPEQREHRRQYHQSNLYREARRRYEQSEKGQQTLCRRSKKSEA